MEDKERRPTRQVVMMRPFEGKKIALAVSNWASQGGRQCCCQCCDCPGAIRARSPSFQALGQSRAPAAAVGPLFLRTKGSAQARHPQNRTQARVFRPATAAARPAKAMRDGAAGHVRQAPGVFAGARPIGNGQCETDLRFFLPALLTFPSTCPRHRYQYCLDSRPCRTTRRLACRRCAPCHANHAMLPSSSRRAQHDGRSSSTSRPGGDDDAQPRTRSIHDYIEALPIQHVNVFWPEAQRPSWLWPWPFPDTSLRIDTPSNETSQPRHLAGWVTRGGPQEVVIVVSGILSAAQVRDHALKPAEEYLDVDLERADPGRLISRVSLVGEVQCGRERGPPPSIKGKERESGSVAWLTVRSMSRKGRNGPGRRGKGPAFPSITR